MSKNKPRNSMHNYMFDIPMGWAHQRGVNGGLIPLEALQFLPLGGLVFYKDQNGALVPSILLNVICKNGMHQCTIMRVHPPKQTYIVYAANVYAWVPPPPAKARL